MVTKGGINTVNIDGQYIHITDLDKNTLCEEWAKRQKEITGLYIINSKANQGWRGLVLSLIGIHLPDRTAIKLGEPIRGPVRGKGICRVEPK